ncbi:putative negative regulator of RcsB-dependent stress response [Paraburkholderia sp. WC7.3d]
MLRHGKAKRGKLQSKSTEMTQGVSGFRLRMNKRQSDVSRFFRHPLVLLIAGFILTGVLGSGYTYWRERRDRLTDLNAQQIESYKVATAHLGQSIYLLELRSYRLYDALTFQSPAQEVRDKNRGIRQRNPSEVGI